MTSLQTKYLPSMTGVTADIIVNGGGAGKPMSESIAFTNKRSESVETCEESVTSDDECDDTDSDNESFDSDEDDDDDDDDYSLNSDIDEEEKKPCQSTVEEKKSGLFLSLDMVKMLRISTSCENFNKFVEDETIQKMIPPTRSSSTVDVQKLESKMVYAIQTQSSMVAIQNKNSNDKAAVQKPKDILFQLLQENNISVETKSYETIKDTFVIGDVSGYSLELMKAVRNGDVDYLRSLIGTQKTFQCCNRFGESIVHAAARRGHLQVLQFLMEEVNVSMSVVCDTGRNPLHDSCWTAKPNFECVEYMIQRHPEYLLVVDKRGYTPLEYAPIDSHSAWSQFLNEKKDLLIQLLKEEDAFPMEI